MEVVFWMIVQNESLFSREKIKIKMKNILKITIKE